MQNKNNSLKNNTVLPLNANVRMPKYLKVYEYLHGLIRRNRLDVGDQLPTEQELAKKFDLNRMTVRKAMDKLVVEEMVVRKRGQGTFLVAKKPKEFVYSLDITTGFFKDMRYYGVKPRSKTLKVEVLDASEKIPLLLDLKNDDKVISILRVFYADDEPIMIENSYLSYSEFKDLLNFDLSGLRYPLLKEEFNIIPHHSSQTFTAVLSDKEQTRLFGFSDPQPCMELEFVLYDFSNVPIEVGYYLYRGDKYTFNINSIEYVFD